MNIKRKLPYLFMTFIMLTSLLTFPKPHKANADTNNSSSSGIVITADRVESSLPVPGLSDKLALRLFFGHSRIYNMTMKKELTTDSGPVTVTMTSKDPNNPVTLSNMTIDITYLHFDSIYIPKPGEIGMKSVTIIARYQSAGEASIPNLQVTMDHGHTAGANTNQDGFDLNGTLELLKQMIKDAEDGKLDDKNTPPNLIDQSGSAIGDVTDDVTGGILNPPANDGGPSESDQDPSDNSGGSPAPTSPGLPGHPGLPDLPSVPELPGAPSVPNIPSVPDIPAVTPTINHLKDTLRDTLQGITDRLNQETSTLNENVKDLNDRLKDYQKQLQEASSPLTKLLNPNKEKQVIQSIQSYLDQKAQTLNSLKADINKTSQKISQTKNEAAANQLTDLLKEISNAEAKTNALTDDNRSLISEVTDLQDTARNQPSSLLKSLGNFLGGVLDLLL
ncbi:MAG: hypothetical protein ACO1OC_09505 [Tuberibacillus sp.]